MANGKAAGPHRPGLEDQEVELEHMAGYSGIGLEIVHIGAFRPGKVYKVRRQLAGRFEGPFTPKGVHSHIGKVARWKAATGIPDYQWAEGPVEEFGETEPKGETGFSVTIVSPESVRWKASDGFALSRGVHGAYRPTWLRQRIERMIPVDPMVLFGWLAGINYVRFDLSEQLAGKHGDFSNFNGFHVGLAAKSDPRFTAEWMSARFRMDVAPEDALLAVYLHECGHAATIRTPNRARISLFNMTGSEMTAWEREADDFGRKALTAWRSGAFAGGLSSAQGTRHRGISRCT